MQMLEINNRSLSYEEYGSGPVALLLHGSPGDAKVWTPVIERLADQYHVIVPNLPGYGKTNPQPAGDEPDVGYAAQLIEDLIHYVGSPVVLAGHSYGGVVALAVALQGSVSIRALTLFEPVALQVLPMAGELETYNHAKTVFDNYIASFEHGNSRAIQSMIDFWFGQGTFDRMPELLISYLLRETAANIKDVQATFRENYSNEAFRQLTMPVMAVVGDRSPDITHRIASVIATSAPLGSIIKLEKANHALISTHVDEIAQLIANAFNEDQQII